MATSNRYVLASVGLLCLLAAAWFTRGRLGPSDPGTAFLGTWTDESGPSGNFLRLELVRSPASGAVPGIEAFDGKGHVRGLFGQADSGVIWNYESFTPLRLNIVIGAKGMVAPVRMEGPDRMVIRLVPTSDQDGWSGPNALEGPGTLVLTREVPKPGK